MTWIYTCIDCDADLEDDDGIGLWCPQCERYNTWAAFEDPDAERDLMIDLKEQASDS